MSYSIQSEVTVTPATLTEWQLIALNEALAWHYEPAWSPTSENNDKLVYACLRCGSIGMAADAAQRNELVENYDFQCCGLTVIFHTGLSLLPGTIESVLN